MRRPRLDPSSGLKSVPQTPPPFPCYQNLLSQHPVNLPLKAPQLSKALLCERVERVRNSKSDYLARRADSSEGRRPKAESKAKLCGSRRFKRAKRVGEQTESLRTRLVFLMFPHLTNSIPNWIGCSDIVFETPFP